MEDDIDPYERQLLAVFKSCDTSGTGILDKNSFAKLCDILQLGDNHRSLLTNRLCSDAKCSIEFLHFREALVAVLASLKANADDSENKDSSCFEISEEAIPTVVFGGKKYGRKSRPVSINQEDEVFEEYDMSTGQNTFIFENFLAEELAAKSELKEKESINKSRNENKDDKNVDIEALCQNLGVHENMIIKNQKLISICNSLGISDSVYNMLQENIKMLKACSTSDDTRSNKEITYGQLFQLIKNLSNVKNSASIRIFNVGHSKTTPFAEDRISSVDINTYGCINYDTLVYLFENAGISDAGIFLNDLGISPQFDVNLSELSLQLQEELLNVQRCMDDTSNQLYTILNPHLLLLQASVVVSHAQIKWYKSCMEQMQCERDKLRNDLLVANERASLLAQEVDDNHARMENSVQQKLKLLEQKHSDQIKKLTQQWSTEREQLTNQNVKTEKQLEQLLYDETKLRSEVVSLKQDYKNLEKENRNLLDQVMNAENVHNELEREIQRLSSLKKKVLELENSNEQAISFLEKMNQLQAENILLRDKNDELIVELENVTLKQIQSRSSCSKRRGNSLLEGEENSDTDVTAIATHRMFPKVRKYNTEKDLSVGLDGLSPETANSIFVTQCESGVEADISASSSSLNRICEAFVEVNEKVIAELKSRVVFLENYIKKCDLKIPYNDDVDVNDKVSNRNTGDLEKQCETLQQRLDLVQKEILKILSEKRACTEENCALKMKISHLMKCLPVTDVTDNIKYTFDTSVNSSLETVKAEEFSTNRIYSDNTKPPSTSSFDSIVNEKRILEDAEALRFVENGSRSTGEYYSTTNTSSPDGISVLTQTLDASCSSMFAAVSEEESEMEWKTIGEERKLTDTKINEKNDDKSTQNFEKLLLDYNRLAEENKILSDKCEELGSCLSMLRNEYDQCEEYWASKLNEERKLFEEEQKINDEKFAELQIKIEEYSEMIDAESVASQMIYKLPPIAENDKLEMEVNDLQEEFKIYREKMELENNEKQMEIDKLMKIINLYETSDSTKPLNGYIARSTESIRSDKTYILENQSINSQNIPFVEDVEKKQQNYTLNELKIRKKQLRKECDKLQREKDMLIEQLIRMKSESRIAHNFIPCSHAIQQHNAEISKTGILLRLRHQELKNRYLRNILLQQQKKLNGTMQGMIGRHEKELAKYRFVLTSTQELWHSLQKTTEKQAEQIALSDVLVKELYCENSKLMATIHQLEQQQQVDYPSPVLL